MNFDQFASSFPNPEVPGGSIREETQEGEVVLAGTILATTDKSCCIDINGAQYEIASSDVIDIQVISPTKSSAADKTETAEMPPKDLKAGKYADKKESAKPADEKKDTEDESAKRSSETVLIKVNRNAVLYQRVPVPATLLAAVGTWMQVVAVAEPVAEAA